MYNYCKEKGQRKIPVVYEQGLLEICPGEDSRDGGRSVRPKQTQAIMKMETEESESQCKT